MKFLSIAFLSLTLSTHAIAEEQNKTETKQQESVVKSAEPSKTQQAPSATNLEQKHQILSTQFLGKRPYMEKTSK